MRINQYIQVKIVKFSKELAGLLINGDPLPLPRHVPYTILDGQVCRLIDAIDCERKMDILDIMSNVHSELILILDAKFILDFPHI